MTEKNQEKKEFSLLISSCFYEVKAYSPYITSLINSVRMLYEAGIKWSYQQISGDSYVDRAKNTLVHHFLKSDYTHMMIIDSDEAWDEMGFGRLVKAAIMGAEVVCGLYPCKNNWDFYGGVPKYSDDGHVMGKEIPYKNKDGKEKIMRLVDMEVAPGGFIIYSKQAFERTRPNLNTYVDPEDNAEILEAFKCNIEFNRSNKSRDDLIKLSKKDLIDEVLGIQHGGKVGNRIGEDVYFQQRYREMGGTIWCEPNINISHFGVTEHKGNFQTHLLTQKAKAETEQKLGKSPEETEQLLNNISSKLDKLKSQKAAQA